MDPPIILINGCPQHSTADDGQIRVATSGPDSSEAARDFFHDVLTCPQCWARDERGILQLTQALELTPEITVGLRREVLRRKVQQNRN